MNSSLTLAELRDRLGSDAPPLLLHVLPEAVFAARRLPGSANACVYEMVFADKVRELAPDPARPIVVYGAGEGSLDADAARDKLAAAGYARVAVFAGGLAEWAAAGLPLEGSGGLAEETPLLDGNYQVDTAQSVVRWTGRNLFNHHHGFIKLAGGEMVLRRNELVSARFVVDMGSIVCEDLTDVGYNALLIRHLRDADFFDVAHHPTAVFEAREARPLPEATPGTPNYELAGDFTLRGVTRPLVFAALVASTDGRRITGQGQIDLDRTEFGSFYGSGKFFRYLGQHVVNDLVHLHVKLHADRV